MSENLKPSQQSSIIKLQKFQEITDLLRKSGPMECRVIASLISGITKNTTHRYLDELAKAGYVRKVTSNGKRKNARIYQFQTVYGSKTDIVSLATTHPLHQITLLMAGTPKMQASLIEVRDI